MYDKNGPMYAVGVFENNGSFAGLAGPFDDLEEMLWCSGDTTPPIDKPVYLVRFDAETNKPKIIYRWHSKNKKWYKI